MTLHNADCATAMAEMPEGSVDAVVCDPPYGLEFMGKDWDGADGFRRSLNPNDVGRNNAFGRAWATGPEYRAGHPFQAFSEVWGREALRVLRPGGYILAFGGTRTYHRLAAGLEDAGFEIRDMIEWLYGSGFPKHASCLKPAHEPIMVGRKAAPRSEPLNIDACRIASGEEWQGNDAPSESLNGYGPGDADGWDGNWTKRSASHAAGRWPANVVLDPEAAAMLDETARGSRRRGKGKPRSAANGEGWGMTATGAEYDDHGGASRFFYCAKAGRDERNAGLSAVFEAKPLHWSSGDQNPGSFQAEGTDKSARNFHPTVKPISLMRWLCRLVTPSEGIVLDPFMGSGTTGCAAVLEGFGFIGIEQDRAYLEIAKARIAYWRKQPVQMEMAA